MCFKKNIYIYTYIYLWAMFWGNINGDRPKMLEFYIMDWKKLFQPVLQIASNP